MVRSRIRTRLIGVGAAVALPAALLVGITSAAAATAPFGVGTVFIADSLNNRVVELPGGGPQTTVGTGLNFPTAAAVDAAGDVFIADANNNRVVELPAGGGPQITVGTGLNAPEGVAVDAAGDVFIADYGNNRVVEVPAGGGPQTTVPATGLSYPEAVAADAAGDVYIADTFNDRVVQVPAGGGPQTTVATGLNLPGGVAVDTAGDVFIADTGHNRVVEVPAGSGAQTSVPATGLYAPFGVAVDAAGDVFIADSVNNRVVEVPAGGGPQTTVPATGLSRPEGVAVYAPPPTFTADTPPATATVGTPYSYTYTATTPAGEPAATFRLASGTLPPGLTLNATTGALSGTPTSAGSYTFQVQTENAATATIGPATTITVAAVVHTLAVTEPGTGSGTVSSQPAGIDCGATCSASFDAGSTVTLTATPASGSRFAGWSGGGCSGTANTCTVTMSADQAVSATFQLAGVPTTSITVTPPGLSKGPVTVTITATDTDPAATITTRCVLDPATAPTTYAQLPATPCPYLGAGATVTATGPHTVYAASSDSDGSTEATVRSATFTIDNVPPTSTVTPSHGPVRKGTPLLHVHGTAAVRTTTGQVVGTIGPVDCWNGNGIVLTLNATDTGSGVANLTYAATGAQPIAATTTGTLPVRVTISKPGLTTVTFYGTDKAGNVEAAHSETVLIASSSFGCALPTPTRFQLPASGTLTITGTITIGTLSWPFTITVSFGPGGIRLTNTA